MYRNFQLLESKIKLVGYEWKVEYPKAVVCLIHGIGEHAGRYDRIGEIFQEFGIALFGMDLRGHGLSSGKRGHTAPRPDILQDIDKLIEYTRKGYPDIPIFLYGHSMGGNIVLDYRRRGELRTVPKGYIATSPWIILHRKIPKYLSFFSKLMARVKPDFQMRSKISPEAPVHVKLNIKEDNQHLLHGKISVKTALEGIEIAEALLNNRLEMLGSEPLKPLLLMHGDADKICAWEGSRKLAQLEKELCTYIEWKGFYHEIHNGSLTSDGTDVIKTMIGWLGIMAV